MKNRRLLLLLCLAWLASCRFHHSGSGFSQKNRGIRLAQVESEDGTRTEWRLYAGNRKPPRIEFTESTVGIVPSLGAEVSAVTRERAESVGVLPWHGVWIGNVEAEGAAYTAGLRNGDIILSLAGKDMNSPEQFLDTLKSHWVPGEALDLIARIQPRLKLDVQAAEVNLQVTPAIWEVRSEQTDSIELKTSAGVQAFTGLQAVQVPAQLARSIYGQDQPIVLTSGVLPGSPAYHAGFRSGDRILSCDANAVRDLDDLRQAVALRARRRYPKLPLEDLGDSIPRSEDGSGSQALSLSVHGPLGTHTADLRVTDRLNRHSDFHIPILFDYDANVEYTDISFLDFIFQFGFNYNSRNRPSPTRARLTTSELSILPLGMFEIEHGETYSRYRLFWLISWRSSRR